MLILRLKRDVARRSYSVTFLNWSPSWHILRLWFTDQPTFKCIVDEEIEEAHQKRRDLHDKAMELISCREDCAECRVLIEHTSSRYLKRLTTMDLGACKSAYFETDHEASFESLPPYAELDA